MAAVFCCELPPGGMIEEPGRRPSQSLKSPIAAEKQYRAVKAWWLACARLPKHSACGRAEK